MARFGKLTDLGMMTACTLISVIGSILVMVWNQPHERAWSPWSWRSMSAWMVIVSTVTAQLMRRAALSWTIYFTVPPDKGLPPPTLQRTNARTRIPNRVRWGRIFATTYGVGAKAKAVYLLLVVLAPLLSSIPVKIANEERFATTVSTNSARQLYFHASDSDKYAFSTTGVNEAIKLAYRYSTGLPLRTQDIYADLNASRVYLPRKMAGACRHNRTEVADADILVGEYSCVRDPTMKSCGRAPAGKRWADWDELLDGSGIVSLRWLDNSPKQNPWLPLQGLCMAYNVAPDAHATFACTAAYWNATAYVAWRSNASECWIDAVANVTLGAQFNTTRLVRPMHELDIGFTNALNGGITAERFIAAPDADRVFGTVFTAATILRSIKRDACTADMLRLGNYSYCQAKSVTYTDYHVRRGYENVGLTAVSTLYAVLSLASYLSFLMLEMFSDAPERFWDEIV